MSRSNDEVQDPNKMSGGGAVKVGLFLLVAAILVGFFINRGIHARANTAVSVQEETNQLAAPAVAVVHPKLGDPTDEITLTGALQAFSDAPIYARASGYIKKWYKNLGEPVKAGEVLAEIEAPEMDLQYTQAVAVLQQTKASLEQAQANLQQSKANEAVAKLTADRWAQLAKDGIVAQQDNDTRQGTYRALAANSAALEQGANAVRATITSQEANLAVLDQLRNYRTVRAPFDGVITARSTDVGALVNATSPTATTVELFHVAATNKLRLFVSVPEIYSRAAVAGLAVDMTLEEFPNRRFHARLVRTGGSIDPSTRTLLSEFEIDNSSGELRPGAYAEVHLVLPSPGRSLLLPVSSIMYRPEGAEVGVVGSDGLAKLARVTIGKDFGNVVEVSSGIKEDDQIIESPPDSLTNGMAVRVVSSGAAGKSGK